MVESQMPSFPRPLRRLGFSGRRRLPLASISVLALSLVLGLLCSHPALTAQLGGSRWLEAGLDQAPEEVLGQSALMAFQEELPHWLHAIADKVLRPLVSHLPDLGSVGAPHGLSKLRRELRKPGHNGKVVWVDDADPGAAYRRWQQWQHEVCYVLGFVLVDEQPNFHPVSAEVMPPLCPELWVDEAWPPSVAAPTLHGRALPVWSVSASTAAGQQERGIMVLQGRLLRSFPEQQVKALMGHELGRACFALLGQDGRGLIKASLEKFSKLYLGGQLLHDWQSAATGGPQLQRHRPLLDLLGLRPPHSLFGRSRRRLELLGPLGQSWQTRQQPSFSQSQSGGMVIPGLATGGLARPLAEWVALEMVLRRTVPFILRPFIYGIVLAKGGPEALLKPVLQGATVSPAFGPVVSRQHRQASWLSPATLLLLPWTRLLVQAAGLRSASAMAAACKRSEVITADRAAALAAGDVDAAAAALLRVHGLLLDESADGQELQEALHEVAESAERQLWHLRRKAVTQTLKDPAVEERVRQLLQWGHSHAGIRLLALAEMRRSKMSRGFAWWCWLWPWADEDILPKGWWQPLLVRMSLLALVLLPVLAPVDLIRWASMCTLGVTGFGLLAPFCGGVGLPVIASASLAVLLAIYAAGAWLVWWNHLLGGSRRWAQLSSRLTSQLADQADVTAGIAYLTRDWAEMARRSLAALDQELCGSWRTSLHELASKLTDLRQDLPQSYAPPDVPWQRSQTMVLQAVATTPAFRRSSSLPAASIGLSQLWLKVDRAVQKTLHVETERMARALETDDPKSLQAMMSWWSGNNSAIAGAAAAASTGCRGSGQDDWNETLGALLLAESLHHRFQYVSFSRDEDLNSLADDKLPGQEEFERLEEALAANFQSLQELKGRLAPMATSAGTFRCLRRQDLVQSLAQLRQLLRHCQTFSISSRLRTKSLDEENEDNSQERMAELRIVGCLALAAFLGSLGVPLAATSGAWLWAAALSGFAAANIVLLLNYQRLSLPHVHRRFERQLASLSDRREHIILEIKDLQRTSKRASTAHARASVFLQSVNVLRNINYVALCIKTESQRAAATAGAAQQTKVVQGGLRLLLALLPRCEQRWEAAILADDDCGSALATLQTNHRGIALPFATSTAPLQQLVADSQKRLWILLRMVHLSSVLPIEAQGHLGSLVEQYIRPILLEGRVPLSRSLPFGLSCEEAGHLGQEQLFTAAGNKLGKPALAMTDSGAATEPIPELPEGHKDTLKQLTATRRDCARVMARLPPQALVGPGQRSGKHADLQDAQDLLHDLFASVLVMVPSGAMSASSGSATSSWAFGGSRRPTRPSVTAGSCAPRAAAALGYRYGEQVYCVEGGIRSSMLLRAATLQGQDCEGASRTGNISDLRRNDRKSGAERDAEEIEIPLTALLDEAPSPEDAAALWAALSAAWPGWYGENALQERRSSLQRVTSIARQLRRTSSEV